MGVHRRRLDESERCTEGGLEGFQWDDAEAAVGAANILRSGGCDLKNVTCMQMMILDVIMRRDV